MGRDAADQPAALKKKGPRGADLSSIASKPMSRKGAIAAFFKVPEDVRTSKDKKHDKAENLDDDACADTACPSTLASSMPSSSSASSTPLATQPRQPASVDGSLPATPREAPVAGCEADTPLPIRIVAATIAGEYMSEFKQVVKDCSSDVTQVVGTNTKLIGELQKVLKANDLDIRSALGQKFSREHANGSASTVAMKKFMDEQSQQGVRTNDAKLLWRVSWAERLYDTVSEGKRHTRSWEDVAKEKGTYVCFATMVEKMGYNFDPQGAIKRARRYADKCVAMKGDWVEYNSMIEELDFFLMEKSHTHIMAEKWAMYEEQSGKRTATGNPAKSAENEQGADLPPAKKLKTGGSPHCPGKDGVDKENVDKGGLPKLIVEAGKVKGLLHGTTSAANSLVGTIESTPSWG